MRTQVTFDCADPHGQAAFWAQVFDSEVEDHSALVDRLVAGRISADDRGVVNDRSAFRDVAACRDPAGKTAKNRVHIDVHVDDAHKAATRPPRPNAW